MAGDALTQLIHEKVSVRSATKEMSVVVIRAFSFTLTDT